MKVSEPTKGPEDVTVFQAALKIDNDEADAFLMHHPSKQLPSNAKYTPIKRDLPLLSFIAANHYELGTPLGAPGDNTPEEYAACQLAIWDLTHSDIHLDDSDLGRRAREIVAAATKAEAARHFSPGSLLKAPRLRAYVHTNRIEKVDVRAKLVDTGYSPYRDLSNQVVEAKSPSNTADARGWTTNNGIANISLGRAQSVGETDFIWRGSVPPGSVFSDGNSSEVIIGSNLKVVRQDHLTISPLSSPPELVNLVQSEGFYLLTNSRGWLQVLLYALLAVILTAAITAFIHKWISVCAVLLALGIVFAAVVWNKRVVSDRRCGKPPFPGSKLQIAPAKAPSEYVERLPAGDTRRFGAENATDGNRTTAWVSKRGAGVAEMVIRLTQPACVTKIEVRNGHQGIESEYYGNGRVETLYISTGRASVVVWNLPQRSYSEAIKKPEVKELAPPYQVTEEVRIRIASIEEEYNSAAISEIALFGTGQGGVREGVGK